MPVRAFCKRYKAKSSGLRAEGISTLSTISTLFNSTFYILHFTFYEGLTPPSLSLCRPLGLLENGKKKRKKKSGLTFNEGLTHPSLSLCRPPGFFCRGQRAEGREHLNLINPLKLLNLLNFLNLINPLKLPNIPAFLLVQEGQCIFWQKWYYLFWVNFCSS